MPLRVICNKKEHELTYWLGVGGCVYFNNVSSGDEGSIEFLSLKNARHHSHEAIKSSRFPLKNICQGRLVRFTEINSKITKVLHLFLTFLAAFSHPQSFSLKQRVFFNANYQNQYIFIKVIQFMPWPI